MLQRSAERCLNFPDSRRNRAYLAQITGHSERNGGALSPAMKKNSTLHRIELLPLASADFVDDFESLRNGIHLANLI